ncbi:MAG: J domain-containing protein [Candidatus Binatia bacterium]
MDGDSGFREGQAVKAYELLGLRPPAEPSRIKAAFRQKLLEWHPDRNPAPKATAMTRGLIDVYNTALENPDVGAKQSGRGEGAERYSERPDPIRSLVIDEHTGEAFISCGSGRIYRLDGDMLRLHWNSENRRDLLYSRTGGSSMLVRDEEVISVLPAGLSVAQSDAIASAGSLRVRGSFALGHLIIYSGHARDIFMGTSAFAPYDHLRFPCPVRDVVIDEAGKRVYIAAGDIYAVEF